MGVTNRVAKERRLSDRTLRWLTVRGRPGLTWTDDVDCRRGTQSNGENLSILDESPHGVSMVSLLPDAIDFTSLKVHQ